MLSSKLGGVTISEGRKAAGEWMVCIPDVIIEAPNGKVLVEVKCPYRCREDTLEAVARSDPTFFL